MDDAPAESPSAMVVMLANGQAVSRETSRLKPPRDGGPYRWLAQQTGLLATSVLAAPA
jgi:hypothetical protein